MIVDTDLGLDDLRALAVLLKVGAPTSIIVTEGEAHRLVGLAEVRKLIAVGHRGQSPTLFQGAASKTPKVPDWLPTVREGVEAWGRSLPEAQHTEPLSLLPSTLTHCGRVDVLVLGPWSSFARYWEELLPRLGRVIIQGLPSKGRPVGNPGFNCDYDLAACMKVQENLRAFPDLVTWVALQRAGERSRLRPDARLYRDLRPQGEAGLVQSVMMRNASALGTTEIWDDAVALYALKPDLFSVVDHVAFPRISGEELQSVWFRILNRQGPAE